MNLSAGHPIEVLDMLRRKQEGLLLQFSKYLYHPASLRDERECFHVSLDAVTREWLEGQMLALPEGWELALDSIVQMPSGAIMHIPMVDFSVSYKQLLGKSVFRELLNDPILRSALYFDSGRGVHAYGEQILTEGEWVKFMGRLLLLGTRGKPPIADSRWIGHRLMGGFGSLRWSFKTAFYRAVPVRVFPPLQNEKGARDSS